MCLRVRITALILCSIPDRGSVCNGPASLSSARAWPGGLVSLKDIDQIREMLQELENTEY